MNKYITNPKIKNKKIIITGASSGIGSELAYAFAANGAIPILLARTTEKLYEVQKKIKDNYQINASVYQVDLTNLIELEETIQIIFEEHCNVDALINNAGMGVFESVQDLVMKDVETMMQLNVLALIKITQIFVTRFTESNAKGHIVNIGSQAGKLATPKASAYVASKHAVIGFTNSLRQEVQDDGIFVTSVNPGPVKTSFFKTADPSGNYEKSVNKFMIDPTHLANKITALLFKKKRELNMPWWMEFGSKLYQLVPGIMETVLKSQFKKK